MSLWLSAGQRNEHMDSSEESAMTNSHWWCFDSWCECVMIVGELSDNVVCAASMLRLSTWCAMEANLVGFKIKPWCGKNTPPQRAEPILCMDGPIPQQKLRHFAELIVCAFNKRWACKNRDGPPTEDLWSKWHSNALASLKEVIEKWSDQISWTCHNHDSNECIACASPIPMCDVIKMTVQCHQLATAIHDLHANKFCGHPSNLCMPTAICWWHESNLACAWIVAQFAEVSGGQKNFEVSFLMKITLVCLKRQNEKWKMVWPNLWHLAFLIIGVMHTICAEEDKFATWHEKHFLDIITDAHCQNDTWKVWKWSDNNKVWLWSRNAFGRIDYSKTIQTTSRWLDLTMKDLMKTVAVKSRTCVHAVNQSNSAGLNTELQIILNLSCPPQHFRLPIW